MCARLDRATELDYWKACTKVFIIDRRRKQWVLGSGAKMLCLVRYLYE